MIKNGKCAAYNSSGALDSGGGGNDKNSTTKTTRLRPRLFRLRRKQTAPSSCSSLEEAGVSCCSKPQNSNDDGNAGTVRGDRQTINLVQKPLHNQEDLVEEDNFNQLAQQSEVLFKKIAQKPPLDGSSGDTSDNDTFLYCADKSQNTSSFLASKRSVDYSRIGGGGDGGNISGGSLLVKTYNSAPDGFRLLRPRTPGQSVGGGGYSQRRHRADGTTEQQSSSPLIGRTLNFVSHNCVADFSDHSSSCDTDYSFADGRCPYCARARFRSATTSAAVKGVLKKHSSAHRDPRADWSRTERDRTFSTRFTSITTIGSTTDSDSMMSPVSSSDQLDHQLMDITLKNVKYMRGSSKFTVFSDSTFQREFLEAHNAVRRHHSVPDVTWCQDLADEAAQWAHLVVEKGRILYREKPDIGENIILVETKSINHLPTAKEIVSMWTKEAAKFDFENPRWMPGCQEFTQLIWKSTTRLGACRVWLQAKNLVAVVAFYSSRGNRNGVGEFSNNIFPPQMISHHIHQSHQHQHQQQQQQLLNNDDVDATGVNNVSAAADRHYSSSNALEHTNASFSRQLNLH